MVHFAGRCLLSLLLLMAAPLIGHATPQVPSSPARDNVRASQAPTGTGRVSGQVLAADTGAPIRRARVMLVGVASSAATPMGQALPGAPGDAAGSPGQGIVGRVDAGLAAGPSNPANRVQLEVETDRTGHYELAGVPAGRYSLMVTVQSGYVPFPRNEPVELRDGEARSVTLRLDRTGVIVGRIVDEYGDPAVRASVRAARRSAYGGAPTTMSMAMTDDLGQFRLFDLRPGVYQLSAMSMAFGYASVGAAQNVGPRTGYAPTYYPGVASPELAQPITVRAAQESHAVFALARVTLGCVRGSVIDSTGAALVQGRGQASGGSVTLYPRMQDLSGFVGGRSGPLQADGTFGICEVPPGDYYVAASLYRGGGTPGAPPASEGGYAPVTVNGDDVHVDVQTNQGATISGRVVIEGNAAPSAGPASAAPARLSVSVRPAQMSSFGGMPGSSRSATVDEIGSFELIGVRGAILLTASINGPAAVLKSVQRGSEDITTTPLDLVGTERIGDVTIVLTRDLGRLEGTVTNSRGEPVPEATIVVFSEDLKRGTDGSPFTRVARSGQAPPVAAPGATASASTTRGPGQYQLPTLVPGRYLAVAFDAGGEPLPLLEGAFLEKLRSLATAVTIAPNDATKLDLTLSKVPVGG